MSKDLGVTPTGSGYSAKPEPVPVSAAVAASIPDAGPSRSARRAANRIERLRARDGDDCWICSGAIDFTLPRTAPSREYPLSATIDHVKQKCDGGTSEDGNVRLAHKGCNHWMLARDFTRRGRGIGVQFGLDKVGPAKERVRRSLLNLLAQAMSPGTAETAQQAQGRSPASAVPERDAPERHRP